MKFRKLLLLTLVACLAHGPAWSNPVDGRVVMGGATFNNQGNLLTITNTPGTIINWQGFSIRPGETTRFVQQGASSAVLNRVVGQDPSLILGSLQSNGRVFVINPNGVLFGAGAQVDVNGLVASTLNITNEDFLAGRRTFNGSADAGSVRNDGAITTPAGGHVYLIAPSVENNGVITSPRGEVMLAAGHHVQLVDSASPDLHVVVSAPDDRALNVGRIVAQGGSVGIYGALVNQRGLVSADSAVQGEDGRIVFKASRETLLEAGSITSARGADHGGSIHILGDHVGLTGDASVDASGNHGGGTVLVGGDFHGANAAITNASATFVGAQSTIRADAIESGDGGRVAVWSDGATRAYGNISARGGERSGNGGFAEVSGRGYLDYQARTDLRAAHGAAGTLLLDPNDITIQNGPAPATDVPMTGPPFMFSGGPASSILTVADLQAQLAMGGVTVSTSGGTGGPNGGRITVANTLAWNNGFSLTLDADNGIAINGAINAQFDGRLILVNRGGTITQTAPINATYLIVNSLGDVNLGSATNTVSVVAAQVGDATHLNHNFRLLNGTGFLVSSLNGVTGISIATSGAYSAGAPDGVIVLSAASGAITQMGGAILAGKAAYLQGDTVTFNEANTVGTVAGRLNGTGGSFSYVSAGALDAGIVSGTSGIQGGGGDVSLTAAAAITGTVSGANLVIAAGDGITLATQASSISASNAGGSAPISITNTGALTLQNVTQGGSGAIAIDNTGALTVALGQSVSSTTGSITLTAHSPLTVDGSVNSTGGGAITLEAGASGSATDQLTINGGIDTLAGPGVAVSTSGPILLRAGDAITVTGPIAGAVTQQPFLNGPANPTLAQCIANPLLPGCGAVLPSLAQCISAPATPGCSVVLPSLAACVAVPSLVGCSVVLPTLAACATNPTLPGCSAVLPTIAACTAAPTLPGCSAVLPTAAACIAAPTLPGCGAVLPSLAACLAAPTSAGCSVVLPSIAACIAAPSTAGCGAVLPSITACIAAPSTMGCGAVLPTLAACIATPAIAGCSAILPTLATCVATPAAAGCSAVLPTIASCTAAPSTAGCSAVLPSLAACTSNPTSPGCSAVLPTLATCTATPTAAGCAVVLPTLASCVSNPTLAGCLVVLPPTQANANQPLNNPTNVVVNLINNVSTLPPTATITSIMDAATGKTSSDTKKDDKKDDKKDSSTTVTDKPGVKNDDAAKKMYCN